MSPFRCCYISFSHSEPRACGREDTAAAEGRLVSDLTHAPCSKHLLRADCCPGPEGAGQAQAVPGSLSPQHSNLGRFRTTTGPRFISRDLTRYRFPLQGQMKSSVVSMKGTLKPAWCEGLHSAFSPPSGSWPGGAQLPSAPQHSPRSACPAGCSCLLLLSSSLSLVAPASPPSFLASYSLILTFP